LAGDGGDQPVEGGAGGQDDLRRPQRRFRPLDQIGQGQPVGGDLGQSGFEPVAGVGGEWNEAEMVAHPRTNGAVGRGSGQEKQTDRRLLAEPVGQMNEGVPGNLRRIVDEPAGPAQAAQVQRGPQAAVRATGAHDLPEIVERPVVQDPVRVDLLRSGLSHRD
jgi:hypothetical protein